MTFCLLELARKQFEDYVDELIKNIRPNSEDVSPAQARELTRRESDAYKDEETLQTRTCLEKVSALSRTSGAGELTYLTSLHACVCVELY
jgi:hypothetical protein